MIIFSRTEILAKNGKEVIFCLLPREVSLAAVLKSKNTGNHGSDRQIS